jgi:hypothetical protein
MRFVDARWVLGGFLAIGLLGSPHAAAGEPGDDGARQATRTFGTAPVAHTISAASFVPRSGPDAAAMRTGGFFGHSRYCLGTACALDAGVVLPAGAVLSSMELAACDEDAAGEVRAQFIQASGQDGPIVVLAEIGTGDASVPGCNRFTAPVTPPTSVENIGQNYLLVVTITGITDRTRLQAVRIFYQLQSSPAPAVATFADVPASHPYFAFVEALWAAGITSGCSASPLLFCPDDPLTRGQAAVLFGRALGLQFSP